VGAFIERQPFGYADGLPCFVFPTALVQGDARAGKGPRPFANRLVVRGPNEQIDRGKFFVVTPAPLKRHD
jgi:hypothetical protein